VAFEVLEKKIFKDLASFHGFSLPVWKIIGILEPFEQIIKRPTQGTFMPNELHSDLKTLAYVIKFYVF
jgi:hypothetical protein